MKTLANALDKQRVSARIAALRGDQPRRWGKMSCHQMVCHLNDSFLCGLGEKAASPGRLPLPRAWAKWGGLYLPVRWPKGIATRPEIEQGVGGTAPVEFDEDRGKLIGLLDRFSRARGLDRTEHPIFGRMTERDWLRWGYLHCDHHLRQFDV